jgi:ubiquinone/menaquinone biosynthesis C-methylase UbiE
VGSSSGYLARKLAVAAGPSGSVKGIDPSDTAIAYAQRRASPTMRFSVGVAQDLELPNESFDVFRVTKPGGRPAAPCGCIPAPGECCVQLPPSAR